MITNLYHLPKHGYVEFHTMLFVKVTAYEG